MANEDYQSSPDESSDLAPTPEEQQAAELAKTRQALLVSAAMQQGEARLPNTLPTQAAPIAPPPPPMTGTQPMPGALPPGALTAGAPPPPQPAPGGMPTAPPQAPGAPGYEEGRGIGVLQPPAGPPPPPPPQGRMYMGPSMTAPQESAFMQSPAGTRTNLMPPPSGPPPPQPTRLQQAQATDQPGSRTIAINDEPKYSDASMANQRNAMLYEAMKKFDAGDRSPEVMAAAMGSTKGLASADQQARLNETIRHNKVTEAGKPPSDLVEKVVNGKTYQLRNGQWFHVPDVRNPMDTETETIPPAGGRGEIKRTKHVPVQSPASKKPSIGDVVDGYRFKGGNASDKSNWQKV